MGKEKDLDGVLSVEINIPGHQCSDKRTVYDRRSGERK
jgi:hypothetical protein